MKRIENIFEHIKEDCVDIQTFIHMPDKATWDDIMYQFYVKKKILNGLDAAERGNVLSHDDVKKRVHPWDFSE